MDFLSKLLGRDKKKLEEAAKGRIGGIVGGNAPAHAAPPSSGAARTSAVKPASGFSWGDEMPDEDNQYNYGGTFFEYFEDIFRSELPLCRMEKSIPDNSRRVIYTFSTGASVVLVVELMSESCSTRKVRTNCERSGIPYLRFYFDHHGWWNTRAYVVKRIRDALAR